MLDNGGCRGILLCIHIEYPYGAVRLSYCCRRLRMKNPPNILSTTAPNVTAGNTIPVIWEGPGSLLLSPGRDEHKEGKSQRLLIAVGPRMPS